MPPRIPSRTWKILDNSLPGNSFAAVKEIAAIPAQILTILANRGIYSAAEIEEFLNPSLEQLPSPQLMTGMVQAVNILAEARTSRTPVLIHGDYDADGVTATALLVKFFREIGLPVSYYLPDRSSDGYGLNLESLAALRNRPEISTHPAPILLTVDCGISSIAEIAAANAMGFRVIVTDHHQPGPQLPAAAAIINPHQPGCAFPFRDLAGVGVAFYLAIGLRSELVRQGVWSTQNQPNLKKYLDLVAIGSVADVVPLRGANRILVKVGLEVINRSPEPGIRAMLAQIAQGSGKVTAETIAYQVAPRLNAAGRTGSAEQALLLLLAEDAVVAQKLAESLSQANQLRKELSEEMYNSARIQAEEQVRAGSLVLVVSGQGWQNGIAGLVASKLAREFWRPAVVLALDEEGVARGSARSVGDIDILACLQECSAILDKYGGHRAAAGVSLPVEKITEFQERLAKVAAAIIDLRDLEPRLEIDLAADPCEIMGERIWNYLQLLEPFGNGNPEPIFCCRPEGIKFIEVKKVGADSLRFKVHGNGKRFSGIGFGMASWASIAEREPIQVAYRVVLNNFRGSAHWEIRAEDLKNPS